MALAELASVGEQFEFVDVYKRQRSDNGMYSICSFVKANQTFAAHIIELF